MTVRRGMGPDASGRTAPTVRQVTPIMAACVVIAALACATPQPTPTQAPPTAAPLPTPVRVPTPAPVDRPLREFDLNSTHTIGWIGFSIMYAEGWLAETTPGRHTTISEVADDHELQYLVPRPSNGLQIMLAGTPMRSGLGSTNSSLGPTDLMRLLEEQWGFLYNEELVEVQVFGVPAVRARGPLHGGGAADCLTGVTEKEKAFFFCVGAPLEQDLEAFLPTWERMLAGIERLDRETGRPGPKMVKVPAPVEAVEVVISELQVRARQYSGTVPEYTLRVISRLRRGGGCSRFDSYEVKKEAHSIAVMVSNLEVADQGASCTSDVPTFITEIPLGTDFDPGQPYTVVVNGNVTNTFVARMPFIPGTPVGPKMVKKAAPIDRVELAVSESEPPEYSLRVVSRLPRGRACSELNGYSILCGGRTAESR